MYFKFYSICFLILLFCTRVEANENQMKPFTLRLDNGLKISCLHCSELPLTAIDIIVKNSCPDRFYSDPVLVAFTAKLLLRGCTNRSNSQINMTLRSLGTNVDLTITQHAIKYTCLFLRWDFEVVFELLSDLIRYPTFEKKEFMALKQKFEQKFLKNNQHYLSHCSTGFLHHKDLKSVNAPITRERVLKCYNHFFRPEQIEIRIAGNLSVPGIERKIKTRLKLWRGTRKKKEQQKVPDFRFVLTEKSSDAVNPGDVVPVNNQF